MMARKRSIKLAAVVLVTTVAWSVWFAGFPADSSAHKLSKAEATSHIRYVAKQVALGMPDVIDHRAGACEKLSQHAYRCTYFLRFADGSICFQRLRVFYRNHSSRRLTHRAVTRLICGFPGG
jgi:hypothetical protein